MEKLTGIFEQIEKHTYTPNKCFLCGCKLTTKNKTVEHVIPKWVQHQFKLWDQEVSLLNGTFIPYRLLTIPCCFKCNNIYLKPFEDKVYAAFQKGYDVFRQLDKEIVFYWLGKIYFGLMYRELFLNVDRMDPTKGTITTPEYLKSFYSHFLFLQGIRNRHSFKDFFPASIYYFKTQKPREIEKQWDFVDNHNTLFIAIRLGEIGIISPLQDGEATKQLESLLDEHRDIDLHPLQFREMTARILYKRLLMNRTPKFINVQHGRKSETIMMPLQGMSAKPIFNDWDNDVYAAILSKITGVPLEICQPQKGKYWTWLKDEHGKSLFIDVND